MSISWHDAILEFSLLHPKHDADQVAMNFDVTTEFVMFVKNSDGFKDALERRKGEVREIGPTGLTVSFGEKVDALAELAVDRLTQHLSLSGGHSMKELREIVHMMLRAKGFGPQNTHQQNTVIALNLGVKEVDLIEARATMQSLAQQNSQELQNAKALPSPI